MRADPYRDEWHHSEDPPEDDGDESYDREYAEVGGPDPVLPWPDAEERQ